MTTTTITNKARRAIGATPVEAEFLGDLPLTELLSDISDRFKRVATKKIELAKAELRADVKAEVAMGKALGISIVSGLLGLSMLLVAAVLALAMILPGWAAALIVAAPLMVTAIVMGSIGWARRVRHPLEATRASLKEDLQWISTRLA